MNQSPHDAPVLLPNQPMTCWRPGQPIPRPDVVMFDEFESYREGANMRRLMSPYRAVGLILHRARNERSHI
ncbi:hypothetical protein ALO95_200081 [Pseudomonas syringae pv. antirrhini]|nr:hypothetical protein ALO95_200081 [Pseudomonas syringae pv. antirrhini]